jgi:hypothetical protein
MGGAGHYMLCPQSCVSPVGKRIGAIANPLSIYAKIVNHEDNNANGNASFS